MMHVVFVCVLVFNVVSSHFYDSFPLDIDMLLSHFNPARRSDTDPPVNNWTLTIFPALENYQVGAKDATESSYPWIARVVHSKVAETPYACTAACIDEGIFITAAKCIRTIKLAYTTVIYNHQRLSVRVFVVPVNMTKQAFDDIGLIVVEPGYTGKWQTIKLPDIKRTDPNFRWFSTAIADNTRGYKVVGYAVKGKKIIKTLDMTFELSDMDVVIGLDLCSTILTFNKQFPGYFVPCYHSCTVKEFASKSPKCDKYHGVEGAPIYNVKTGRLLGIATWGAHHYTSIMLPVGFSVPNTDAFFKDLQCAKRIRDDLGMISKNGYYQSLCGL